MKKCYLCGVRLVRGVNMTRDHVPPKSIFPSEKPPNLLTVPCCERCRRQYEALDQRMRNHIAVLAGPKAGEVGPVAKEDIFRDPGPFKEFLIHLKEHPTARDESGEPRPLYFFGRKDLDLWIGRIVKGLIFAETGEILPKGRDLRVIPVPEFPVQPSMSFPMEEGLKYRPSFVYGRISEPDADCWILIFYDHIVFRVELGVSATH